MCVCVEVGGADTDEGNSKLSFTVLEPSNNKRLVHTYRVKATL